MTKDELVTLIRDHKDYEGRVDEFELAASLLSASIADTAGVKPFTVTKVKELVRQWQAGACSCVTTDGNGRMTQISFSEDSLTFFLNMVKAAPPAPSVAQDL